MQNYHFKLDKFQGPLDLLLTLIEERKLSITDVSLSKIVDQYLDYIKNNPVNPENISAFLVVASKLLLIKSLKILPELELTEKEEEDIEDFKVRVKRFQKFQRLARRLEEMERRGEYSLMRRPIFGRRVGYLFPNNVDIERLKTIYEDILDEFPEDPQLERKNIDSILTVRERIDFVQKILRERLKVGLSGLHQKGDRVELILTFLALLELFHRDRVNLEQGRAFGEIFARLR